ncbi:MAG: hypothetical protein ACXVA4_02555 [Ktedonobacterales bacterium]
MFQPRIKLEFITRYCPPSDGWDVFLDIDPSEEGRTGGSRLHEASIQRQQKMIEDAVLVRKSLAALGVHVGSRARSWKAVYNLRVPYVHGDRDIFAVNESQRRIIVVEVEGDSSGQPESKVYRAVGQAVVASNECSITGFDTTLGIVVHGRRLAEHLIRCRNLEALSIFGLHLSEDPKDDVWLFGPQISL